jgi:hypothetical protein
VVEEQPGTGTVEDHGADSDTPFVPQILVATPHYGQSAMGYVDTVMGAQKHGITKIVGWIKCNSSLLPTSFNEGLAYALSLRDIGRATHFAMVHSDILAERGWLDTLWSEMWINHADVVSTLVPIKNDSGRTSTAIGDANDPWKVKRCIYLEEAKALPETFGPESVCKEGEVLLVNTGCWLADLRRPWWDNFAFNLHSRIIKDEVTYNLNDGVLEPLNEIGYHVETRSEDWEMSQHLAKAGARVMVTRRVKLKHEGINQWSN